MLVEIKILAITLMLRNVTDDDQQENSNYLLVITVINLFFFISDSFYYYCSFDSTERVSRASPDISVEK